MIAKRTLLAASLLLGLPWPGHGQAPGAAAVPRYYVGAALFGSDYQPLARFGAVPVQLTVGYQLRSRLAVQVGAAYSSGGSGGFLASRYYPPQGSSYAYFSDESYWRVRSVSVAPLLRYTLSHNLAHRFQVDVLAGATYVHYREDYRNTHTDTDSAGTVRAISTTELSYRTNELLLTAGLSPRLRLGRHLDALADLTLSYSLAGNGLASGAALGLRYRFGAGQGR